MNFIMKGIHAAIEPFRYTPAVTSYHQSHTEQGESESEGPAGFIAGIRYRRRVRRAVRELSRLSNETLDDIGVERGNIPEIVARLMKESDRGNSPATHQGQHNGHTEFPVAGGITA